MNSKLCFQLLVDAVLFGVIPIVYEYEGTTSEALMMKLEKTLAGRTARYDFPKKSPWFCGLIISYWFSADLFLPSIITD